MKPVTLADLEAHVVDMAALIEKLLPKRVDTGEREVVG